MAIRITAKARLAYPFEMKMANGATPLIYHGDFALCLYHGDFVTWHVWNNAKNAEFHAEYGHYFEVSELWEAVEDLHQRVVGT
jgi:hypothetical protein